jgi:P pilus assembly chaperone PapD
MNLSAFLKLNVKLHLTILDTNELTMRLNQTIVFLLLLLLSPMGWADMYVDRSIVIFEPETQPRQDIKVSNSDEEVMYVQVEVFQVNNPGEDSEERIKVNDPKQIKLIATPNKLVIPAGGQKLVRIVNLDKQNDVERIYRINITPIVAPLEDEVSQLRIIVAYQVLAIIQPKDPRSELVTTREVNKIIFHNDGSTNVLLSDGRQCNPGNSEECTDLASKRLYAGNTWELDLPFDSPVAYSVRSFDGIKKQVFP